MASLVVETFMCFGNSNTLDHSLPLMLSTFLTNKSLLHHFHSSEEFATIVISVHVDIASDFTSWYVFVSYGHGCSFLHEFVNWAAHLFRWLRWCYWDFLGVFYPVSVLKSIPVWSRPLVNVATMMPVA